MQQKLFWPDFNNFDFINIFFKNVVVVVVWNFSCGSKNSVSSVKDEVRSWFLLHKYFVVIQASSRHIFDQICIISSLLLFFKKAGMWNFGQNSGQNIGFFCMSALSSIFMYTSEFFVKCYIQLQSFGVTIHSNRFFETIHSNRLFETSLVNGHTIGLHIINS